MADDTKTAELELAVRRFGEAWASGDWKTLEALLSPTYTHVDVFGALNDRASWLSYAAGALAAARTSRSERLKYAGSVILPS